MSAVNITIPDSDIDIVIGALHSDLTSFLLAWKPFFTRYHLIVVKDPGLYEDLLIPTGFDISVYTAADIDRYMGSSSAEMFAGYSSRYFGYLMSRKKYIVSIDDDCIPAKDNNGYLVDVVAQHMANLTTPATPYFFNTLYDPFRDGADFVRGYPFSLRDGVPCALSCGLWLHYADLDAPTHALKPERRNTRYVDAVLTIPTKVMMPISGINFAFERELLGPTLFPALRLGGEGKLRWETMEDIWCGMCIKVICDHLKLGVKTGLPYVWRKEGGDPVACLKKEWEGMKLMNEVAPFFQSLKLPPSATTAEACVAEIAKAVKEQLGSSNTYARASEAMTDWINLWRKAASDA